ncbi:MAG TPA: sulfur carrier protein ThiS [Syntrophorhabdaceae bacterium]|nr:sulfur carrier protein ThiS [Syntrophorhabdaceae bacterium]
MTAALSEIEIILNGIKEKVPTGTTIKDLIVHAGEKDKHLVVERNNCFVHGYAYKSTVLDDGDRVELINPDFGG